MPWTQQEECQTILPEIRQRLDGSFPDKTTEMVKTRTNCLIFILTTVILGSEHCFIYKQIASDLMVQIFNETKPLQYLQLDLPIQIIRKIASEKLIFRCENDLILSRESLSHVLKCISIVCRNTKNIMLPVLLARFLFLHFRPFSRLLAEHPDAVLFLPCSLSRRLLWSSLG